MLWADEKYPSQGSGLVNSLERTLFQVGGGGVPGPHLLRIMLPLGLHGLNPIGKGF